MTPASEKVWVEIASRSKCLPVIPIRPMTIRHIYPLLVTEVYLRAETVTFVIIFGTPSAKVNS